MPVGPRIRANNVYGLTTDNPLTIGATIMNSTGLTLLPAVSSAHAVLVLDPKRVFGEPEIVVVTSHVALSTSATIVRGQYGTSARSHAMNTAWAHVAIHEDYVSIVTSSTRPTDPYLGEIVFETDTVGYVFWNGSTWISLSGLIYRIGHTFTIPGDIAVASGDTDFICPFFVPVQSGRTVKLVAARHRINSGTSATVKLTKNGVDITGFTALSVTTTSTTTDPADIALIADDLIALVVTAVSGSPKNLSFSLYFEHQ